MGSGKSKPDLLDVSMELKMTARQMERQSQKIEQSEKADRKKIVDVLFLCRVKVLGIKQRQYGQCKNICRECDKK
jgi:hypothetical protein